MIAVLIVLLCLACLVFAAGWRITFKELERVDVYQEKLETEAMQRQLDLNAAREDAARLSICIRDHIHEMDRVAKILGGSDSTLMLSDEREALRKHEALVNQSNHVQTTPTPSH